MLEPTISANTYEKPENGTDSLYTPHISEGGPADEFSLDMQSLDGLDGEFGVGDDVGAISWPFPSFPSQLEAMNIDLDLGNIMD